MQKTDIVRLITLLFESKFKRYTEITINAWVELIEHQNYPDDLFKKAIEDIIYLEDDFISIKKIHDSIVKNTPLKINHDSVLLNKAVELAKEKGISYKEAMKKLKE